MASGDTPLTADQLQELTWWRTLRETPELLEEIRQQESVGELRLQQELRQRYPAELVRLALELHTTRVRAREKFPQADQLWLTRRSYEQATSTPVAQYKANRYQQYASAGLPIHDYCCGIGVDAMALAECCPVIAYDLDPVMLQLARWNAALCRPRHPVEFRQGDARQAHVSGQIIHIDPDQRDAAGRRHLRLELIQPELSCLQRLADECRAGGMKLSPASNFGGKFPHAEMELVSWQGECKLATAWCGELGEPGLWRATVLPSRQTLAGDPLAAWGELSEPLDYVYDPDPAVVRAGLVNLLCETQEMFRLDEADEYLTCPRPVNTPFARGFRVQEVLPRNEKHVRQYLRQRGIGIVEIKCRQVPLNVEQLRRSLNLKGDQSAILIYARIAGKTRVLVAQRLPTTALESAASQTSLDSQSHS